MMPTRMRRAPLSAGTPRAERGRTPDGRSVAIAAGDSSPALTGARGLSREADSDGSPGSDGPPSWTYDNTSSLHKHARRRDRPAPSAIVSPTRLVGIVY